MWTKWHSDHPSNHSRRLIFVHRITRGIPNTKPELGIGAVSWVSLIRFTAFQNRCLPVSRSGYSCKVGVWSNRPLSTIFLTSLSPLGKALMERCRKTYLRCSKTRCVMFFLQFQWLISAMLCPFLPSHCSNSQGAAKGKAVLCRGPPVFGRLQIWEKVNKY